MTQGAVVAGAHINGLGVIRGLAARGVPIAAVTTRPFDSAHHSRWVSETHRLPQFHDQPESLVELLERNEARWRGWAVFPTNDDALTVLAKHHERLSRSYRLPLQPWEAAGPLVDKDRMHDLAEDVGLDLPACHGRATPDTAAKALHYPVLVKPIQHDHLISSFGTKLFFARDQQELRVAIDRLNGVGLEGLVYDFVPGRDTNLHVYCVYMDARGEPSPGITVRKMRQDPPVIGGPRAAVTAPEEPVLREATVELLRRVGFRGMAFAEFKRDPRTGRFVFIEVNPRAVQFNNLLPPTGIDLVGMTWSDFVLGEPLRPRRTAWEGSWIHLEADIRCSLAHRSAEQLSLGELLAPYRRPKRFAVWSASDPRPFLAQTLGGVRGAVARARNGAR